MPTIILICKMNEFWFLILVSVFAINSLDKAKSVQLEETPHNPLDEIFGEGWWNKDKAEEWDKLTLEHNFHHQIDRQNTQLRQIEPNSTDQNPPLTESDHSGQIVPNSTDQNSPLTESDHSDNAKNGDEQNEIIKEISSNKKRKIIDKFYAIKDEFEQKGKLSTKERTQIEVKIAKHLKVNRTKIFEWKKELGLSQKILYEKEERKHFVEKFDQMKAELTLAGFKNSYKQEIDKTVAKELGLSLMTIYRWKSELGQIIQHKHSHSEKKKLMKRYYEIKDQNPKISDKDIAKSFKISRETLYKWKRKFKRGQLHPTSVDGHSLEENAVANVQEIENSNLGSI